MLHKTDFMTTHVLAIAAILFVLMLAALTQGLRSKTGARR
jgi:hypothetical protein